MIKDGDKVKIDYEGRFEDGTVFDSSKKHGQPIEFEVGKGQVIKGFNDAVIGMEPGEEKEITLEPKDAYGDSNPDLIKKVPLDKLPEGAKAGMMLGVGLPNGQQVPAKILEVSETEATLDMNHPMSGKTLIFKIKVIE